MGRYLGASCRLCRRVLDKLFLKGEKCYSPKCPLERRGTVPGDKPRKAVKLSTRGYQWQEKQKARRVYGLIERQFKRMFEQAQKMPGAAGENLLILLERRLDNVVFRLGWAPSRAASRQIVRYGHILVNNRKVDIPSFLVKPGDVLSWGEQSRSTMLYENLKQNPSQRPVPSWLSVDGDKLQGRVLSLPTREEIELKIDEKAIVEFYAR